MGEILGITGPIHSGKSTFKTFLSQLEPSHACYESYELIAELGDDFNRALSGELAFETTTEQTELVNQALIWFVEAVGEKLHREDTTWNQLAITARHRAAHPELFEKLFAYLDAATKTPTILDARITSDNKEVYRPLLQWLGAYLVAKISPTVWYDEIFRRIELHDADKSLVLVSGLRYPSDAAVVRAHGGKIISIERPIEAIDSTDPTEAQRSAITPDITVINNGSFNQLQAQAEQLYRDIGAGNPRKTYTCA